VSPRAPQAAGDRPPPAPCPFCGQRGTRELTLIASRTTRYFRCDRCHRTFAVDLVISSRLFPSRDDES